MAYVIRSADGLLSICTSDADAAAEHLVRLQLLGLSVEVRDVNGASHHVTSLLAAADAVSDARTSVQATV